MDGCENCYKYHHQAVSKECDFCRDYAFKESILCDLLRAEHRSCEIECSAFRHNLSVVGEINKQQNDESDKHRIELTDKHKYLTAYAIQQWKYDDSKVFCDLNYHLCILASNRNRLFQKVANYNEKLSAIFDKAGDEFEGRVSLICVGPDHIHLYINSSPNYSADDIARLIIAYLESAMKSGFQEIFKDCKMIFQKAYFIETIS